MIRLKPAALHLDQLNENFKHLTYTNELINLACNPLFDAVMEVSNAVDMNDCSISTYKYAIVDDSIDVDAVLGYFSYEVNWLTRAVGSIFLMSFYEKCPALGLLIYKEMNKLIKKYHSVSWRCIDTCEALETYKHFTQKHGGYIYHFPQSLIDTDNKYHDKYEFYIVNEK